MLQFFKKIRQNLLAESKFTKYLIYALGEIVLVVIGILIALQINNWNESKKIEVREIGQLKSIQEDIMLDEPDIKFNLTYHKLFLDSEQQLLNYMMSPNLKPENPIKYEHALGISLILILHESAFNNLRNNNLNIISSQKLKKEISNHYDSFGKTLLIFENDHPQFDNYLLKRPYFLKYFNYKDKVSSKESTLHNNPDYYNPEIEMNKLILIDTLGLKKDEEFKIVLAESILYSKIKIQLYENLMLRNKELIEAIDTELFKLEN
ncbi:DUF6090 family protein [Christiangramia sabulilitoris]|uniref:Uncharacterized protein n=1 Tax=Christiangramia sabulilitoris TaxID=2583991 RepID=A0A550I7N6_9FLAO|nr:DUF6090 family protein [Christiangramia sabulilitoris]TRO66838.1 hypothetical protein FGM01_02795 [Christiangramia sabulilitoris]